MRCEVVLNTKDNTKGNSRSGSGGSRGKGGSYDGHFIFILRQIAGCLFDGGIAVGKC
jgi:hypothetical protein